MNALARTRSWVAAHCYLILGAVLVAGVAFQALNELWSSDVFEHLAVVRELTLRPFDPSHALLPIDAAHPFYSPYTVALGIVGNVTGLGAVTLLKLASVANAVFLLAAYRRFVRVVSSPRYAAFFGLLAVLLVWGPTSWRLSGFLNLNSIGYGMPYPSTFATTLMLVGLAEVDLLIRGDVRVVRAVFVGLAVATILITHPITGIATVAGIAGFWIGRGRVLPRRKDGPLLGALAGSLVLVTIWPYYSFWRLLFDNGEYVESNHGVYEGLPLRLLPLGILVVLLALRRPNLRTEPLLSWACLGAVLYVIGFVTGQLVLGRTLAFVALAVLTEVGIVVAAYVERPHAGVDRAIVIAAGVLAVVGLVAASPALLRMVPRSVLPSGSRADERLAGVSTGRDFLSDLVPDGSVIAAYPDYLSEAAPAFAGKVVATPRPVPFVDDIAARRVDVERLFGGRTTADERRRLVTDYQVDFLLFDDRAVSGRTVDRLRDLGPVVYDRDHVVMIATST